MNDGGYGNDDEVILERIVVFMSCFGEVWFYYVGRLNKECLYGILEIKVDIGNYINEILYYLL